MYQTCTWCPEDLNCEFHNSFFTFFRGYLLNCSHGEYSKNGYNTCTRNKVDNDEWCEDGYYKVVLTSEFGNDWIHEQDETYQCIPINQPVPNLYTPIDSTYAPDCTYGERLKYGVEGCNANSPGFYNALDSYSETTTRCTDGYYCTAEMINGELKIAQKSCPRGSMGMTSGASSEHLQ